MITSGFIHVAASDIILFFFITNIPFCVCICMCVHIYIYVCVYIYYSFIYLYQSSFVYLSLHLPLSIYSSFHGHLGCLHVLTLVNSAAMNIGVHVSFWIGVFIFSIYTSKSGIARSQVKLRLLLPILEWLSWEQSNFQAFIFTFI